MSGSAAEALLRWPLLAPPADDASAPRRRPSLSVVVAAYEAADVLADALESVFAQTVSPLEIVVCDDGSTDGIDEALAPYRDRIILLRREHGGEAAAKNTAVKAASGDFIVILDADDVFLPKRLEAIADVAEARPDLDLITTDAYLEANGEIVRRCYDGGWTFETHDQRRELLRRNFVFGLAAVRRSELLRHGGFDERILYTTDWECWIRLVLDGARIGCIDEPLAHYRLWESSLSADRDWMARGKIATLEKTHADPRLTAAERRLVERSIAGYRRELALLESRAVLLAGRRARGPAAAIALGRGFPRAARAEAALAAVAPGVARRRLMRLARETWVGAGGIRVRRRPPGGLR